MEAWTTCGRRCAREDPRRQTSFLEQSFDISFTSPKATFNLSCQPTNLNTAPYWLVAGQHLLQHDLSVVKGADAEQAPVAISYASRKPSLEELTYQGPALHQYHRCLPLLDDPNV